MKNHAHIVLLEPPAPDSPGKYFLTLYRQGGMMGLSSAATFAVDGLKLVLSPAPDAAPSYYQGYLLDPDTQEKQTIVQFPLGDSYLLYSRSLARVLTREEFQKECEEEHGPGGQEEGVPHPAPPIGQYV